MRVKTYGALSLFAQAGLALLPLRPSGPSSLVKSIRTFGIKLSSCKYGLSISRTWSRTYLPLLPRRPFGWRFAKSVTQASQSHFTQ
jgi:hypothetical protein